MPPTVLLDPTGPRLRLDITGAGEPFAVHLVSDVPPHALALDLDAELLMRVQLGQERDRLEALVAMLRGDVLMSRTHGAINLAEADGAARIRAAARL